MGWWCNVVVMVVWWWWCGDGVVASELYGVNATIIIFVFVLYRICGAVMKCCVV